MSSFILSAFADEIDQDLKIQMDVLDDHDIKYIEMRGVNGNNLTTYSLEEVREIKKQLDDRGFKLSAVGSPIGKIKITDDFAPHLDLFKHTLEIAHILESKYIRLFSFYMVSEDYSPYRDEVMERMNAFVETAKGSGITLLHENEKGIYGDTPENCLDILETINSPSLRATFDPANFVQCDVDTASAIRLLSPYVEYLHIKDALYKDHSVVPAGMGDGKIKEVLTFLKEKGFSGFLSLEPHLAAFEGSSDLELDDKFKNLPKGGPKTFAIAVNALKKVLLEV